MNKRIDPPEMKTVDLLESLMEMERLTAEQHRRRAWQSKEQRLRSLFTTLADAHERTYSVVRSFLDETEGQTEITHQINEMFL
jgi:hypothetical protein